MPCEHLCCSLRLNPTGEQMCEPASYFEQEAAAISKARGPASPVTSSSPAGREPAVWILPSCQPCPCPWGSKFTCFPPDTVQCLSFCSIHFLPEFSPRCHAGRKKAVSTAGLCDIAYFLLLLKTPPCMHTVMQAPPFCISKKSLVLEVFGL